MIHLSDRMSRLGTETAFEVLVRARALEAQGHNVVHLEIGEPDFDTPDNIRKAGADAIWNGFTHYGPSFGLPQLREAIAEESAQIRGVPCRPEEVVVTPGAKPIMFFAILALAQEGDEVVYPNPGFPIYESVIKFAGATPVPSPLHEHLDFRLDVEELKRAVSSKTRLLILNSPQNPTGSVLTRDDLKTIAELAVEHDFIVLADEIYRRILYSGEHVSIQSFPGMKDRTIILDGFSKTYAMTGWRLGYGIMPEELARQFALLHVNSNSCTASFTQIAGVEAVRGPQARPNEFLEEFRRRRDAIAVGLNDIPGITCKEPQGAFYVFPNVKSSGVSSKDLANRLLQEAHVACLAGSDFGAHGEGYLRFSYANSLENITEALRRMRQLFAG